MTSLLLVVYNATLPVMSLRRRFGNVTLANQLSLLRLVASPCFALAVLAGRFDIACAIYAAAAITDLLDGLAARIFKQETSLGQFLDPLADKILCTVAFVLLTDYPSLFKGIPMVNRIPVWLTVFTISRDVFIVIVAVGLYLAYGTTRFRPTIWGKLTTVAESVCVALFLLFNQMGRSHRVLAVAVWTTLALLMISGFDYLRSTVRRIRDAEPQARRVSD